MNTALDISSIAFAVAVVFITLTFCLYHYLVTRRRYPGFWEWGASTILFALWFVLLGLRSRLPEWLTISVSSTLVYAALVLLSIGLRRFVGRPLYLMRQTVIGALLILGALFFFTYVHPTRDLRFGLISLAVAVYFALGARLIHREVHRRLGLMNPLLMTSLGGFFILFALRSVYHLSPWPAVQALVVFETFHKFSLLTIIALAIITIIGWIQLHTQRVEKELAAEQQELLKSEARFRDLFNNMPVMLYSNDGDGRLSTINHHWSALTGYTQAEVVGRPLSDFLSEPSQSILAQRREAAPRGGEPLEQGDLQEVPLQMVTRSGANLDVLLSDASLTDRLGRVVYSLGVIQDVTAKNAAAETQRKLELQLLQAQKMETVGILAGGIAHDFNNLLASIIGYTELSLEDVDADPSLRAKLHEVLKASIRARDLVKQILTFARQSDEALKPIQVSPMVKEVLSLMRASIPTSIVIDAHLDSGASVMANANQLHQVLMNLCTNAAHAMHGGQGNLMVTLSDTPIAPGEPPPVDGLEPGDYLTLTIADTGCGIPADIIERIFDPYFTTKPPGSGTGMGLALVQGIVEGYGGKIRVTSQPDRGTCFDLYLPAVEGELQPAASPETALPKGTEQILFVDDEPSLVSMGTQMLERLGYRVRGHTSSRAALNDLCSAPADIDLLITDMTMPEMTGDQLAEAAHAVVPHLPVLLCTGYRQPLPAKRAADVGIQAVLLKPTAKQVLAQTIRRILDARSKSAATAAAADSLLVDEESKA
jgi:PAS domain S-box-containing protein